MRRTPPGLACATANQKATATLLDEDSQGESSAQKENKKWKNKTRNERDAGIAATCSQTYVDRVPLGLKQKSRHVAARKQDLQLQAQATRRI